MSGSHTGGVPYAEPMATRFYFPRWDGRAAPVAPPPGTQWEQTANVHRVLAATTKGATAPTSTTSSDFLKTGEVAGWDVMQVQATSDTLDVAQDIAGTFSAVVRIGESGSAADLSLQIVIRVVSQDGASERGVLYGGHAAALTTTAGALGQEAGTTASTRIVPAGAPLAPVSAMPGDRVVVEVGSRSHAAAPGLAAFMQLGDNAATADHALAAGSTSALCPWVELSQDLTFGEPVFDVGFTDLDAMTVMSSTPDAGQATGSTTEPGSVVSASVYE